jgi:ABC-2 type transport system ATP-binding protein
MSAARPPAVAISARGLSFVIDGRALVDAVDLEVAAGEIFGVVGADGAGKTTLLRLLTGQLAATSGDLQVLGLAPADTALRQQIAYMPQSFGQYLDLSVRENLAFYAALHGWHGAEADALAADLVARAGLRGFEERRAGQLSGGMMQKLALACALVSRPRAMFLDEPTTGVDPVSRRAFWQLLERVRSAGVAVVCATANMQEAERCDRVAMMAQGRISEAGSPLQMIAAVRARLFTATPPDASAAVERLRAEPGVEYAFRVGRQVRAWLAADTDAARLDTAVPAGWQAVAAGLHDIALRQLALARAASHA